MTRSLLLLMTQTGISTINCSKFKLHNGAFRPELETKFAKIFFHIFSSAASVEQGP